MLLLLLLICYGTVKAAKTVIFDSGRLSEITVPLCWWCWELSTPLLAMGACAALQPSPTHRCLQVMVEMLHAITLLCTWSQATATLSPELQEEITEGTTASHGFAAPPLLLLAGSTPRVRLLPLSHSVTASPGTHASLEAEWLWILSSSTSPPADPAMPFELFLRLRPPARNGSAPLAQPGAARGEAERSGGPALSAFGPQREPQPRADCGRGKGHSNADGDGGGTGTGQPQFAEPARTQPGEGGRSSRADPTARTSSDLQVIFFSLSFFVCLFFDGQGEAQLQARSQCQGGRSNSS